MALTSCGPTVAIRRHLGLIINVWLTVSCSSSVHSREMEGYSQVPFLVPFFQHTLMVVITVSDGNWVFLKLLKNYYSHFQGIRKLRLRVVKPHIFAYKAPVLQLWNLNFLSILLMTGSSLQLSIILVAYSYTYSSKAVSLSSLPWTSQISEPWNP